MKVERVSGQPGQPGRLCITDEEDNNWFVPVFRQGSNSRHPGTLAIAQTEYEHQSMDIEPGMSLKGDLNDACRTFLDAEFS